MPQQTFAFDESQRWFHGRTNFRPSREPIDPSEYGVEQVERQAAIRFVESHHYARSCCPQIASFGLFRKDSLSSARLVGVAVFSQGSNFQDRRDAAGALIRKNSITAWTGLDYDQGAELGRFVLLSECPGNAETWFLAEAKRQFKVLRPEKRVVLSYSDPCPRTDAIGNSIFLGHYGCIYHSVNAYYMGRNRPKTQILDAAGREVSRRAVQKFLSDDVGASYALTDLQDRAGVVWSPGESRSDFVRRALETMRVRRHPGNHVYVFALGGPAERRRIGDLPAIRNAEDKRHAGIMRYPKRADVPPPFTVDAPVAA